MGKPSAPAAPDYAAAATAQGAANVQAAQATNYLNQANQVGPNGSLTYSYDPNQGHTLADGTFIPQTTATTTLSPGQQKLYDQNLGMSTQLNDLAAKGISYVGDQANTPINQSNLPTAPKTLAQNPLQGSYDFSNVAAMPKASDFAGQRDQITNAMMERLRPEMDRQQAAQDAKLANQGITHGSEAYNWDQTNLQKGFNDQRVAALLAGDQEQQNLYNNAVGLHQQGISEATSQGNLANTAAQGTFNQGLASAQYGETARQQALQEQAFLQSQPLNMLNALRTGNQVNMPQFGSVSGGSQIGAAPIYQATADQYSSALQQYQAQLQSSSGLMGALGSLGSAAIFASDRRLKENIKAVGMQASGLMAYSYNYLWSKMPRIGYMADEVRKLFPEAVIEMPSGYLAVDYGKVK